MIFRIKNIIQFIKALKHLFGVFGKLYVIKGKEDKAICVLFNRYSKCGEYDILIFKYPSFNGDVLVPEKSKNIQNAPFALKVKSIFNGFIWYYNAYILNRVNNRTL